MNSIDLKLDEFQFCAGENCMTPSNVSFDENNQTVELTFDEQLETGLYKY